MSEPATNIPSGYSIDDLPRFSDWPLRLLGLAPWISRKKTPGEVEREFGQEKWGLLLERYRASGRAATLREVEGWMCDPSEPQLCSVGRRFELLPTRQALSQHYALVADSLHRYLPSQALVELGAGFGSAILRLAADPRFARVRLYAAEYTDSGVELMRELACAAHLDLGIGHCDLVADPVSDLSVPEQAIVFTCMAAHYVPELRDSFVHALARMRPAVVVHFEPCYEHFDTDTLTGALRRRYVEVNDYNRNLVTLLRHHAERRSIRILEELPAVIGLNPLLPISVLAWSPAA